MRIDHRDFPAHDAQPFRLEMIPIASRRKFSQRSVYQASRHGRYRMRWAYSEARSAGLAPQAARSVVTSALLATDLRFHSKRVKFAAPVAPDGERPVEHVGAEQLVAAAGYPTAAAADIEVAS